MLRTLQKTSTKRIGYYQREVVNIHTLNRLLGYHRLNGMRTLVFLVWIMHQMITESLEDLHSQNLGEDVSQIVTGVHTDWSADLLVTEHLDPLLTVVDMLQLRLEDGVVSKRPSCIIVHLQLERLGKLYSHLLTDIRQMQYVLSSIAYAIYLCSSAGGISMGFTYALVGETHGASLRGPEHWYLVEQGEYACLRPALVLHLL